MFNDRHATLSPLFNSDNKISSLRTLIELLNKNYLRMKDNIIDVGANTVGTYECSDVLWYDRFTFGENVITTKKKNANMPLNGCLKEIKIEEMKGKYVAITCQKKDIMNNKDVFIVNDYAIEKGDDEASKSGRVLLLYCVHDHQKTILDGNSI